MDITNTACNIDWDESGTKCKFDKIQMQELNQAM